MTFAPCRAACSVSANARSVLSSTGIKVQDMLAQVQYFPNDLERRMNALIKAKIDAGEIRPKRGMRILEQYLACFQHETYIDTRRNGGGDGE